MSEIILLVDDNAKLLAGLKMRLEILEYQVLLAHDGLDALRILDVARPDLIVSDIMMPGLDGWELFDKVRSNKHLATIPFIFLTARSDDLSNKKGKALGAEDYIAKPFDVQELIASIKGRLRRVSELNRLEEQKTMPPPPDVIKIHKLKILTKAHQVFLAEKEISLTPIEFSLLLFLVQNSGQACLFEKLAHAAYTTDYQPWKAQETLRVHINNLRRKLNIDPSGKKLITNVRSIGYRLEVSNPS